jgi:hypothetical protein
MFELFSRWTVAPIGPVTDETPQRRSDFRVSSQSWPKGHIA